MDDVYAFSSANMTAHLSLPSPNYQFSDKLAYSKSGRCADV
jgi:hypothetical protein